MYLLAVADPSLLLLQELYRFTGGDTQSPVPVTPALGSAVGVSDLVALLEDLGHRGLVRTEPPNLVFLTASGVRNLFIKLAYEERRAMKAAGAVGEQESQDILIEEPDDSQGDDEVDLGAIMDLVREGQSRRRGESGVRLPPKGDSRPAMERLDRLQADLDQLTKELALNSGLSLPQWTQALELKIEIRRLLETIRRIAQPRA